MIQALRKPSQHFLIKKAESTYTNQVLGMFIFSNIHPRSRHTKWKLANRKKLLKQGRAEQETFVRSVLISSFLFGRARAYKIRRARNLRLPLRPLYASPLQCLIRDLIINKKIVIADDRA